MSASFPTPLPDPDPNEVTVQEWIGTLRSMTGGGRSMRRSQPTIAAVSAAAVDPLEIAACLEVAGMSRNVVSASYGQPDVFALANEIWNAVPFQTVPSPAPLIWRPGNAGDLGRGALYAAPALMLLALTVALDVRFAWWTLPLAITWGWAFGQVTVHLGYSHRGRNDAAGEAAAVGWLMLASIASTAGLAAIAAEFAGGGRIAIVGAVGVTTYMVAGAVLLLHDEEVLGAQLLAPGGTVAVAVLVFGKGAVAPGLAAVTISGSALATLGAAGRHLRLRPLAVLRTSFDQTVLILAHLAHGLACGIALALVMILGGSAWSWTGSAALLAMPLLLTLGVMEWQLRTFRAGVERRALSLDSIDGFAALAWALFRRSLARYMLATAVVSAVVAAVIVLRQETPPYMLLLAQLMLGATFSVDLTLVSLGRLDIVLRCWCAGFVVGAGWLAVSPLSLGHPANGLWTAAFIGVGVTFAGLLDSSRSVVSAAMNH